MPTLWLSCHVDYACRHSGACCRSGWPLPVEDRAVPAIAAAVAGGRLRSVDGAVIWLEETAAAPAGMAGTFRLVDGGCVFHTARAEAQTVAVHEGGARAADRHCAVHATLGHAALPASCQHFPRVCLIDGRGVRVTLSHFCPTAAAMLIDDERPVTIVPGPPAVTGLDVPEGLDARDQLPPRLTERVLMDPAALTAWEAHVVAVLAGPDAHPGSVDDALARLQGDAARLTRWTPSSGPLVDAVRACGAGPPAADAATTSDGAGAGAGARSTPVFTAAGAYALGTSACRAPWAWPAPPPELDALDARFVAPRWLAIDGAVRRYLAGKAFGAWISYQADGAHALMAWLELAHTVLRVECARATAAAGRMLDRDTLLTALREADRLLLHHADSAVLAEALSARHGH